MRGGVHSTPSPTAITRPTPSAPSAAGNTGRTRDLIHEIAAACAEQSAASQSVARSIEQVAQLADRNETLVRENSDLSRYLDQLAGQLTEMLNDYRYE